MDLGEGLAVWTDWDGAMFVLGRALGIFAESESFADLKGVFWSNNPLGNALHEILLQLVAAGVVERRDEPDEQFRWSNRPSSAGRGNVQPARE